MANDRLRKQCQPGCGQSLARVVRRVDATVARFSPRLTPVLLAVVVTCLGACRQTTPVSKRPAERADAPRATQAASAERPGTLVFYGACDASGAVPLDSHRFLVADDEDNILRVFDVRQPARAESSIDLSVALATQRKNKEFDLEAATRLGDTAYFITSHGRNRKAKRDPNRLLFFALSLREPTFPLVGKPYERLLDELLEHPLLQGMPLAQAAELAPKAAGGLNIEGLTATPDGGLWVGLRNPIPDAHAILFRIDNPARVVEGETPQLSSLMRLDLGGLGVRSLSSHRGQYLIVAGPAGEGGPFRLYRWDGSNDPVELPNMIPEGLSPEGFFTPESSPRIMLLSDDGSRLLNGTPCKKHKDSSSKRFRGFPLVLP